jgi:hypothetical protein
LALQRFRLSAEEIGNAERQAGAHGNEDDASTLNDRLFPGLGNGGYDALSYDVSLDYRTGTTKMPASVTMRARATQSLSRFSLDSAGQQISSVTVDGPSGTRRRTDSA